MIRKFRERLILFLIRRHLGVTKRERFRFVNQKHMDDFYWIGDLGVIKFDSRYGMCMSGVSLNWLLNDNCEIVKVGKERDP